MNHSEHDDPLGKDYYEDVRILRDSDYWDYLSEKTQDIILTLLGEPHYPYTKEQ